MTNGERESPTTEVRDHSLDRRLANSRVPLTILLLAVGVFFLLLLNGQEFTNGVVFLFCCAFSLLLWLPAVAPRSAPRRSVRRVALIVIVAHAALACWIASSLPHRYARQRTFNEQVRLIRDRADTGPVR